MTGAAQDYVVHVGLYWPIRAGLEAGTFNLRHRGRAFTLAISHPQFIDIGVPGVSVPAYSFTLVEISWVKPHQLEGADLLEWAKSSKSKLLEEAEAFQNHFIDLLFTSTIRHNRNLDHVRHFGIADWAASYIGVDGMAVGIDLSPQAMSLVSENRVSIPVADLAAESVSFLQKTLQRSYRIANSGYPTESLLLSAAVIDATTQQFLERSMRKRGLAEDSAKELLRNTTTKRLKTYLDPVLKLVANRSLSDEQPALYARMVRLNEIRNDAIHNGRETSRSEAIDGCKTAYEILSFLYSVDCECTEAPVTPFI
ncbi:hypothetical protein G3N96_32525 [Burkholderia sp. Se-20373]|uniref:hypothetical protein n=1 Tax=Burkholderia sp. Se-20373 TaxID=2703898 RepID=UPI00197FA2C5|nr:hypothetical protein [Burkholderia sp. Se-20373]MBN3750109.1 hypothetical protein [Burkholderia sp. Se-20373]